MYRKILKVRKRDNRLDPFTWVTSLNIVVIFVCISTLKTKLLDAKGKKMLLFPRIFIKPSELDVSNSALREVYDVLFLMITKKVIPDSQ